MNSVHKSYALTLSPPNDISAETFSEIRKIFDGQGWQYLCCRELAGKWHAHFGLLAPFATTSSCGKRVRNLLKKFDPEQYANTHSIKIKAWYVGGPGFEPKTETGNGKYETWEEYMGKDLYMERSDNFWVQSAWEVVREDILWKNKPPEEQKKVIAWGTMEHWKNLLLKYDLAFDTINDIECSISNLCFNLKVEKMPDRRNERQLVYHLFLYMNGCEGNAMEMMDNWDIEKAAAKKKKWDKLENPPTASGDEMEKLLYTREISLRGKK